MANSPVLQICRNEGESEFEMTGYGIQHNIEGSATLGEKYRRILISSGFTNFEPRETAGRRWLAHTRPSGSRSQQTNVVPPLCRNPLLSSACRKFQISAHPSSVAKSLRLIDRMIIPPKKAAPKVNLQVLVVMEYLHVFPVRIWVFTPRVLTRLKIPYVRFLPAKR